MGLDSVIVGALRDELESHILDKKLEKIQQPEKDILVLTVRGKGGNFRILISAINGSSRVCFTNKPYESPKEALTFCMLLRKHLSGATIVSISQPLGEKILEIEFLAINEMRELSSKHLVIELIGNQSNVILVDDNGRIVDSLKRVAFGSNKRYVLPGMYYRYPEKQNKTYFFSLSDSDLFALIHAADKNVPVDRWLLSSFSGIAPIVCRELAYRAHGKFDLIFDAVKSLTDTVRSREFTPCSVRLPNGKMDYSFISINQYGINSETQAYTSFSELLEKAYSHIETESLRHRRFSSLKKTVSGNISRLEKKLIIQRQELESVADREFIRQSAELITVNLHRIKKGDSVVECDDYYSETGEKRLIILDPLKSTKDNAACLYKKYNKLKNAEIHLKEQIKNGEDRLDYLHSVRAEIEQAYTSADFEEIKLELTQQGIIRIKSAESRRSVKSSHKTFLSPGGTEVWVGKNNLQNDAISLHFSDKHDYWFHVQSGHGSHVILRCGRKNPCQEDILFAAGLAAEYSSLKENSKVAVDYTKVMNLKKPSGFPPGKVLYSKYHTIIVQTKK